MQHALGLTGRARGVENEERVFRVHGFRFALGVLIGGELVVINIPPTAHGHLGARAPDHDAGGHVRALGEGFVDVGFQRHHAPAAQALVAGDNGRAAGGLNTIFEGLRRKAAEYDGMNRADARAGQHRVRGLGNHGQVQADAVAAFNAACAQGVGQAADLVFELRVGDRPAVRWIVAFPDQGDLLGAFGQVPVDTIDADVEFAAREPTRPSGHEIKGAHLVPGLVPGQKPFGHLAEKCIALMHGALVHGGVVGAANVRIREVGGNRVDVGIGHRSALGMIGKTPSIEAAREATRRHWSNSLTRCSLGHITGYR